MYFKYRKKHYGPYEYIKFDEANMNWNIISLYEKGIIVKVIDLEKITFFYISKKDPRIKPK